MTPPHGLEAIKERFGDPAVRGFEGANIVLFHLPYPLKYGQLTVTRSRCHRLMVPIFTRVLHQIREAGLAPQAASYGGIYAARPIRGASRLSTHAWGIAIDLNPATNALGTKGSMDPRVVELFKAAGFTWGGDFTGRKDPMHFQFCSGY